MVSGIGNRDCRRDSDREGQGNDNKDNKDNDSKDDNDNDNKDNSENNDRKTRTKNVGGKINKRFRRLMFRLGFSFISLPRTEACHRTAELIRSTAPSRRLFHAEQLSERLFTLVQSNPSRFSRDLIQVLVRIALNDPSLKEVDLALHTLSDTGAEAVAEALKTNATLTSLDLTSAEIGDQGVEFLAEALLVNTSLRHLDLQCNNFGEKGIQALCRALDEDRNRSLTSLRVFSSNAGDTGALAMADVLRSNSTLCDLAFGSGVTDVGATILAQALRKNSTLTSLSLHSNDIADNGAIALADALAENTSLKTLNLEFNLLTELGRSAINKVSGSRQIIFDEAEDDNEDNCAISLDLARELERDISQHKEPAFSLSHWLAAVGTAGECLIYLPRFLEHHLTDASVIQKLTAEDLKNELGILSLGHRLLIIEAISQLREGGG